MPSVSDLAYQTALKVTVNVTILGSKQRKDNSD